jgi:phosphopantetheinyl transferase
LKEAFVKCIGTGLDYDLKKLSFGFNDENIYLSIDNKIQTNFSFQIIRFGNDVISICYDGPDINFNFEINDLCFWKDAYIKVPPANI